MDITKRKGNITEMKTMLSFMENGWNVLTPYGDCERYDYVVDIGGKFLRMQCKTAAKDKDGFYITCKSMSWDGKCVPYSKDEIDYFVTFYEGKTYLIPVEKAGRSSFKLRTEPTKTGQQVGINWAKEYEMDIITKDWEQ